MNLYTFYNRGSITAFNPDKKTKGPDGSAMTMLEFHKQLVVESDRRDVYIINHKGKEVICLQAMVA